MKTRILLNILILGTVFASCNSFLKDDSGDLLIPSQISEFQPLLYGEGYPRTYDRHGGWLNLATDDVELGILTPRTGESNTNSGYDTGINGMGEGRLAYTWQLNMDALDDKFWDTEYAHILACNTVIDALPDIVYSENETGKYNYLAAQAYMLRAYHYFSLINTYAEPYSQANLDKPGVILRLEPAVQDKNLKMPRATVGEVYTQIVKDLELAGEYMAISDYSNNIHLLNPQALSLLRTRVAIFMEDWDTVIEEGTAFLKENSHIFDLNTTPIAQLGRPSESTDDFFYMLNPDNKEVVFSYGRFSDSYAYLSSGTLFSIGFRVSYTKESSLIHAYKAQYLDDNGTLLPTASFKTVYDDSDDMDGKFGESELDADVVDLRLRAYFKRNIVSRNRTKYFFYYPMKYYYKNIGVKSYAHENWRTVEVVLNLAEAYARKATGVSADAIGLINNLRKNRILASRYVAYTTSHFASKDELIKFIWQERRRELCFEEYMRFWDLRRQGGKQLYHKWLAEDGVEGFYMLPANSPNWTMPIPASEIKSNDLIEQNPRNVIDPL